MNAEKLSDLLRFLRRLDEARIAFTLRHSREDAIMVEVCVPGERWEIEFVDYGDEVHVEIECFRSNGKIHDERLLEELFAKFSDAEPPEAVNHHDTPARK